MKKQPESNNGFVDLQFAKLDTGREARRGLPEIIYAPGKTTAGLKKIIREFKKYSSRVFISKLEPAGYKILKNHFPSLLYFSEAKIGLLGRPVEYKKGFCLVITAGTSDIPIAEEAAVFLELTGNMVKRIYDVGAAGVHRLMHFEDEFAEAKVIIVAAGMEAALLSVISGLTSVPLIGLPTSVGYGASFKGLSALLGMMNSCSLGSVVVNVDNGLGAGYFANLINK